MLLFFTILLLAAIWGIIKPFKGLSRKQFGLAAAVLLVVCILITPSLDEPGKAVAVATEATSNADPEPGNEPIPAAIEIAPEETEPSLTGPQNNAVRSAEQYLNMSGFSRDGLIQQLSSDAGEGFSVSDATAAVDSLSVDWNENAAKSAKAYLDMSGFSCKGLIKQLSSRAGDKYTDAQATFGAQQAGAC